MFFKKNKKNKYKIFLFLDMLLIICLFCFSYTKNAQAGYYDYNDVLLIINDNSDISVQIGNYFKQQRNIPDANVVHLHTATTEAVDATEFTNNIRTPIENYLTSHNLQNSINYIVTTKGLPLTVNDEGVEQQLMLILGPYSSSILQSGPFNQPYYNQNAKFSHTQYGMYLVTRLDGYNWDDIKRIIDRAAKPASPDQGTFVIDIAAGRDGSSYQPYNDNMRYAAELLIDKGLNVVFDQSGTYLTNIHNVLGYHSWGSNDGAGANNSIPGNTYANGAIGDTYVSSSGRSFSYPPSYGQSLIADWIAEGITGIAGYVSEPYATAVAVPQFLYGRYARGYNLADSFAMATIWSGWKQVVIGDPKTVLFKGASDIPPDTTPPARYGSTPIGSVNYVSGGNYYLQLNTDEPATCHYSATPNTSYASMMYTMSDSGTSHYSSSPFRYASGTYAYYVRCRDTAGNTNTNDYVISFTILGGTDTTPPVRYNGYPSAAIAADQTETSLALTTNENATCKYSTTPNTPYDSMGNTFSAGGYFTGESQPPGGSIQSVVLRGLNNGSSYTYYVRCRDNAGNTNTDDYAISFAVGQTDNSPAIRSSGSPSGTLSPALPKPPYPLPPTKTPPADTPPQLIRPTIQ